MVVALATVGALVLSGGAVWGASTAWNVVVAPGEVAHCNGDRFVAVDAQTARCEATAPTVPTPPASTPPVVVPPVPPTGGAECPPGRVVAGPQTRFESGLGAGTTLVARNATWDSERAGDYPVSVFGRGSGSCWSGGAIRGDWPQSDPWDRWHHRAAFRWSQPDMTVENVVIANTGDALKPKDEDGNQATNWTVRRALVINAHDDCLENDYVHSGLVDRTLFAGCYVGISARPSSSEGSLDGRHETVTIRDSMLRLLPMASVYKGPSPGTGGFFKWTADQSPALAIVNSVFRADLPPNHQDLGLPDVPVTCRGNVVLWGGAGPFPGRASWLEKCPDTRIVEGAPAKALWDAALVMWGNAG